MGQGELSKRFMLWASNHEALAWATVIRIDSVIRSSGAANCTVFLVTRAGCAVASLVLTTAVHDFTSFEELLNLPTSRH